MNKIQLVIADWAGTTVDYGCFAPVNAFEKAFQAFDIHPSMDEIREPMGLLKIDHIRAMLNMERKIRSSRSGGRNNDACLSGSSCISVCSMDSPLFMRG